MSRAEPILVGVDAGATKSVAIAVAPDGGRVGRAVGEGANPKRHGLAVAADRIAALARSAAALARSAATSAAGAATSAEGAATRSATRPTTAAPTPADPPLEPSLVFVAGAGIDRPEHARALEAALVTRLAAGTRVHVVNDTLAVLRSGIPEGIGLAVPVSTGGNVIGRGPDGRVTDRGHGIFGGGYALGALVARRARRGLADPDLARAVAAAAISWLPDRPRRPGPEAARLGEAVAAAAERGDRFSARLVDRWCRRVTAAVGEEVARLGLGDTPAVVVYGGLGEASPWLAARVRAAVLAAAPGARLVGLDVEPADGAADLARDAWAGRPVAWSFTPRR